MITNLEQQAQIICAKVGIPFLEILTILREVLACWTRNDEPNAPLALQSFKRYHAAHPEQCLRRTARRVRADADMPMTKEQSFKIGKAIIEQALSVDDATASACCQEAGSDIT